MLKVGMRGIFTMQTPAAIAAAPRHFGSAPFLVIEDSQFDQERIRRMLAHSFPAAQGIYVSTLEDARTVLETVVVSLIVLDNNLPDGKGANFALGLFSDPEFAQVPIIMVSDWPSPFMFHKAEMAQVMSVVGKAEFRAMHIRDALTGVHGTAERSRAN